MRLDFNKVAGKVFTSPLTEHGYGVIRELQGNAPSDFPSAAGWTPVAEDGCGNYFAISLTGSVGFWDHETSEVTLIAESLPSFYEHSTEPGEVILKPGQVKSAWIDPEFARQLGLKNVPKHGRKKR